MNNEDMRLLSENAILKLFGKKRENVDIRLGKKIARDIKEELECAKNAKKQKINGGAAL